MQEGLVSIVIPARNEQFLQNTVTELLTKAQGPIEIIVTLDGYWPNPPLKDDPRLKLVHRGTAQGMRPGINSAVAASSGEYIMKIDAHCMVDEGYDIKLKADCENNWIVIPRRKRLDAENWCIQDVGKPDVDYECLSFPDNPADYGGPGFNGRIWTQRIVERKDKSEYDIDDDMSGQGSSWFMKREYFDFLELMDTEKFGPFWNEMQELGFKTWLSGGALKINKNTWYAHLHKGKKYGRGYNMSGSWLKQGASFTKSWMNNDAWHKQTLPFSSMIERFWPLPGWPENWKNLLWPDGEPPIN